MGGDEQGDIDSSEVEVVVVVEAGENAKDDSSEYLLAFDSSTKWLDKFNVDVIFLKTLELFLREREGQQFDFCFVLETQKCLCSWFGFQTQTDKIIKDPTARGF